MTPLGGPAVTITKNFICRSCGGYGKNHVPGCPHYRPPAKPCRHCKVRGGNRGRRLCHACRADPAVLALYPPLATRITDRHVSALPAKPERKPGEGTHRCLWCGRWRCGDPLRLCEECQQEYDRRAVGVPELGSGGGVE